LRKRSRQKKTQKWNKQREEERGVTKAEHIKKTKRNGEINKMQK
jgi:hypothetical protein